MRAPKKRPDAAPQKKANHLLATGILAGVLFAAFSNSFAGGFVLDAKPILLEDPRIREATAENLGLIFRHTYWWPHGEAGLYRPLTTLSYLFNYAVLGNGTDATGYHWLNFLLHAGNVLLVYVLALRLMRKFWPAVLLAGIWGVHPLLTESVTNLVGRSDLLAATAVLGGFWIYLKSTEATGGKRGAWLAALALTAAAGFFAKESAVVLIAIIGLFEWTWWRERKQGRKLIPAAIALLIPLAAMLWQRAAVLSASPKADFPFTDNPILGAGFWTGKLTAIKILAHYLWLTAWPVKLSADYSYSQIPPASGTSTDWLAWISVLAAGAGTILLFRRNRTAFFLSGFAFLTLLPTANLIFPIGSIMAERFLYLPSIGLIGCLVLGFYAAGERLGNRNLAPAALALIGAAFGARTWARNLDWHDDLSLDTAAVRSAPRSFKAHKMLAVALMQSEGGRAQLDRELEEVRQSMAVVDALPDNRNDPGIYRLAANLYLTKGDSLENAPGGPENYRMALAALQRNIAIRRAIQQPAVSQPEFLDAETGRMLSAIYERLGDTRQALDAAVESRREDPLNPQMYRQLAGAFLSARRPEDAAKALMEGMIVTQDMGIRRDLVELYRSSGIDSRNCAIVTGPNGPAINPACGIIHDHLCGIAADAIRVRLSSGRRDIAEQLKRSFLVEYGCPAAPIEQAMNGKPGS